MGKLYYGTSSDGQMDVPHFFKFNFYEFQLLSIKMLFRQRLSSPVLSCTEQLKL